MNSSVLGQVAVLLPRQAFPTISARVCVEQASTFGWTRYAGLTGEIIGMKTFGASAPLKEFQKKFGFTTDHIVAAATRQIRKPAKAA